MIKMSMVSLDLLPIVDLHLDKTKILHKNLSVILSKLLVIILSDDFFQFFSITRSLQKLLLSLHKEQE